MNNEPVAWMYRMKNSNNRWELIFNKPMSDEFFEAIPLYTHPVKELTDEEIREVAKSVEDEGYAQWKYEFARAILRKAQEK